MLGASYCCSDADNWNFRRGAGAIEAAFTNL